MTRRSGIAVIAFGLVVAATPARAQSAGQTATSPEFLTTYHFHLDATSIHDRKGDDPRFKWDANFGGDIDLVDYGRGRVNFLTNYQVVLGDEFRAFDPNQGGYTLDFSASYRTGPTEVVGLVHHTSRHLSDRAKSFAVDWNSVGVRAERVDVAGRLRLETQVQLEKIVNASYVDYRWQIAGGVRLRYPAESRVAVVVADRLVAIGVDHAAAGRDTQYGAHAEAGARLTGTGGALELFLAVERRIDPHPLAREARTWALVGFRFLSR